jgi:glutathione synthase/RimK-type ligase-like ATP-grasp enzyme
MKYMNKVQINKFKATILRYISVIDKKQIIYRIYKQFNTNKKIEKDILNIADKVILEWPDIIPKPVVGLVRESELDIAYWPKFERFLRQNDIPYEYYNPHESNFWKRAEKFDFIIWRTNSSPHELWEAKAKIELLSGYFKKEILPKVDALWFYEEKIKQQWLLEIIKIPCIKTFITYSFKEALDYINNCEYPFISKENTNSGSRGVHMIKTKSQARKFVNTVFTTGKHTLTSYLRQKNYVIFQEYTPNYDFDLRVIVIGNQFLGYYRHVPENDFRASGAGIYSKKEIPKEALLLAKRVRDAFPKTHMLAVDMLQDKRDDLFKVIETSIFISVETSEQLKVDGVPGLYKYKNGDFHFEPGRYWIQELALKEAMEEWLEEKLSAKG